MPSRIRHRELPRLRWRRAVSPAAVSAGQPIDVMPAIEQPRRHHVEGLKVLVYEAEGLLEIGQDGPGELIHQKRPISIQHCSSLAEDLISDAGLHRSIRDARDYVVRTAELQIGKSRIGFGRRSVYDMQSRISQSTP